MGTKAHDLFVLPLCRKHHDELHADTVVFEEKYGSQLELIFSFLSIVRWQWWRAGLILWRKLMRDIQMVLDRWGAWAASVIVRMWTILPVAAGFKGLLPYGKKRQACSDSDH